MCLTGSGTISIQEKRLQISEPCQVESKTSQFEIGIKLLARFSTQFRVKVLNRYLLHKLRKFGDNSRDSLKKNCKF